MFVWMHVKGVFYGCRPMISLDTCHLRGFVKGQILVAVGIDANDGMYLIAFAVCEGENNDSWKWFLRLLLIDIKHPPAGAGVWNFISDQHKVNSYCLITCFSLIFG
jgi:hypothetical protein